MRIKHEIKKAKDYCREQVFYFSGNPIKDGQKHINKYNEMLNILKNIEDKSKGRGTT